MPEVHDEKGSKSTKGGRKIESRQIGRVRNRDANAQKETSAAFAHDDRRDDSKGLSITP